MKILLVLFLLTINLSSFADGLINTNIVGGCVSDFGDKMYLKPVFTPKTYNCANGYYLPANTDACIICPQTNNCYGGNFVFNKEKTQGLSIKTIVSSDISNGCDSHMLRSVNNVAKIKATFVPNQYTCNAGFYLLANSETCAQCPANSYCPGGTLTFNETTAQGINPCPNNQTSLPGSSSVDQCKTVNLTWVSNGETYTTSTCTINGLITMPEPPTRPGYTFTGWTVQKKND